MTIPCKCKHAAQDAMYSAGYRVHNPCWKDYKIAAYRCTVCGDKKDAKKDEKK